MSSRTVPTSRFLAALCLGLAAMGAQALEMRGFRGVAWGDGAEALGPASVAPADGSLNCYTRERENLLFADATLSGVRYCFRNDRLVRVMIDAAVDAQALASQVERLYGHADAQRGLTASWGAASSKTRADVMARGTASRLVIYSPQEDTELTDTAPRRVAGAF